MSLLLNLKKRKLKDLLNPFRWVLYSRMKVREIQGTKVDIGGGESLNIKNDELQSYIEQIIYRQSIPECKGCLLAGHCHHCGCKTPDLFYDKEMMCSGGNFDQMMSPIYWEQYKLENNIKIGVVNGTDN